MLAFRYQRSFKLQSPISAAFSRFTAQRRATRRAVAHYHKASQPTRRLSPFVAHQWAIMPLSAAMNGPSEEPPTILLALSVILGLPVVLWAYKCFMMYIFQRKIIYMGYVPPGSRTEKLSDVAIPKDVECEHIRIPSDGRTVLSALLVRNSQNKEPSEPKAVMLYLQGNAGNPLQRLPVFAILLQALPALTILAPAPRSYWTSSRTRPTERGLLSDYTHALKHAAARFPRAPLVLYGHSLGASAAVCLLARLPALPAVRGLVLENPMASTPAMLRAVYPQRWLPYHHMGALIHDRWDARAAARAPPAGSALRALRRDVLVLASERDEVVPTEMARAIWEGLREGRKGVEGKGRFVVVRGALHEDAWMSRQWVGEMKRYIEEVVPDSKA